MSDLQDAETLADLQDKVEFDIDVLEKMGARLTDAGQSHAAAILDYMRDDLQSLRLALIACGIWEEAVN